MNTIPDEIKNITVDKGYLFDWYIASVSEDDLPVWTEEHIEELCNDFYVIPKELISPLPSGNHAAQ